jgi:transcriptional regulator with XRE-family HTH domain
MHDAPRLAGSTTARELRDFRKQIGMSLDEFACLMGSSGDRTIRRWEAGEKPIPQYMDLLIGLYKLSEQNRQWMLKMAQDEWAERSRENMILRETKKSVESDAQSVEELRVKSRDH